MVGMWCGGRLEQEIEELETGVPVSKSAADKQNLINVSAYLLTKLVRGQILTCDY